MPGTTEYGVEEYGSGTSEGDATAGLPEVTVVGPASPVDTVGFPVTWTYTQPNGVPQSEFRVRVLRADLTVAYDSGWQAGAATMWVVPGNLGLDDEVGAVIRVTVAALNRGYQATADRSVDLLFGKPTVTWVFPDPADPTVQQSLITADWSYADTQGKAQAQHRVRLEFSGEVVYDSGWINGPATTHDIPYLLSGGSRYRVGVLVRNSNGVESG